MKIKRQNLLLGFGFALGSSLLLFGTLPVQAQVPDRPPVSPTTDGTGVNPSGSPNTAGVNFSNVAVQNAVDQAAANVVVELNTGSLTVAENSPATDTAISQSVQQSLASILTGASQRVPAKPESQPVAEVVNEFASNLSSTAGGPNTKLSQELVSNLQGLFANKNVEASRLMAAVKAYNAAVDATSGEFLTNPPAELLAIQSVLSTLMNDAAKAAS